MSSKNLSEYNKEDMQDAKGLTFGIVVSQWNNEITNNLFKGAYNTLIESRCIDNCVNHIEAT